MMENLIDNQSYFNMQLYSRLEEMGSANPEINRMREMVLIEASLVSEIISNYEKLQSQGGDNEEYDAFYAETVKQIEERKTKM